MHMITKSGGGGVRSGKYIKYNGNTEAIYYIGLSNDLNSYFVVQRKKKMKEPTYA